MSTATISGQPGFDCVRGEYVIPQQSAREQGMELLEALNEQGAEPCG